MYHNKGVSQAGIAVSGLRMNAGDVERKTSLLFDDVENLMKCVDVKAPAVYYGWELFRAHGAFPQCKCVWTRRLGSLRSEQDEFLERVTAVSKLPWQRLGMYTNEVLRVLESFGYSTQSVPKEQIRDAVRVWIVLSTHGPNPEGVGVKLARKWNKLH